VPFPSRPPSLPRAVGFAVTIRNQRVESQIPPDGLALCARITGLTATFARTCASGSNRDACSTSLMLSQRPIYTECGVHVWHNVVFVFRVEGHEVWWEGDFFKR